ncbi:MAG: LytTR family DNA-binding domain-containing protein [Gilvibacter sp.]
MRDYFVIEKDPQTVASIKSVIDEFIDMRYIGVSHDFDEALNTVLKTSPDLIFINIDAKGLNAFELIREIKQYAKNNPTFVVLSESKAHAYEVFKLDIFDYILTPTNELSLRKCILKYKKKHPTDGSKVICLKSYKDYHYLNTDEILFLKADNNTTDFHLSDGSVVGAFKTLKTFGEVLPKNFMRIHKSYIINIDYISRIQYGKALCIIRKHAHQIPFTKTFMENVEQINTSLSRNVCVSMN